MPCVSSHDKPSQSTSAGPVPTNAPNAEKTAKNNDHNNDKNNINDKKDGNKHDDTDAVRANAAGGENENEKKPALTALQNGSSQQQPHDKAQIDIISNASASSKKDGSIPAKISREEADFGASLAGVCGDAVERAISDGEEENGVGGKMNGQTSSDEYSTGERSIHIYIYIYIRTYMHQYIQ
jgi:hypothetical protein